MTLEERVQRLEDIETIRNLQAKYQRCLDSRDFDGLDECFDDDVISKYGDGKMFYQGKDEVLHFLMKVMKLDMPSTHLIHGGEINWIDNNNASAKWYLEDHLVHKKYLVKLHGAALYDVKYIKDDNGWKIKEIGYTRCYQYVEFRGILNLCTLKNTNVLKMVKKKDPQTLGKYGQEHQYKYLKKRQK